MRIGLIHGSSQKDKNEVLYEILQRIAKGHEIVNFGCFPNEEGKIKAEYSKKVDDLREVLNEFPYVSTNFYTYVTKTYKFSPIIASHCRVQNFNDFYRPKVEDYTFENGTYVNTNNDTIKSKLM